MNIPGSAPIAFTTAISRERALISRRDGTQWIVDSNGTVRAACRLEGFAALAAQASAHQLWIGSADGKLSIVELSALENAGPCPLSSAQPIPGGPPILALTGRPLEPEVELYAVAGSSTERSWLFYEGTRWTTLHAFQVPPSPAPSSAIYAQGLSAASAGGHEIARVDLNGVQILRFDPSWSIGAVVWPLAHGIFFQVAGVGFVRASDRSVIFASSSTLATSAVELAGGIAFTDHRTVRFLKPDQAPCPTLANDLDFDPQLTTFGTHLLVTARPSPAEPTRALLLTAEPCE